MTPHIFGDPLTFHLAPVAGQIFHSSSEISQHLLDQQKYVCTEF